MKKSNPLYWFDANAKTFSNFPWMYMCKTLGRVPKCMKMWDGTLFNVLNLNSNIGTIIEVWHEKDYGTLEEIAHQEGAVIIDIGANIGAFTLFASKKPNVAMIYAFEPESNNFQLLEKNIILNKLADRVRAVKKAVCGSAGKRLLNVADDSSGNNSFMMEQPYKSAEEVSCTTLSDVFAENNIEVCHLLKLDCEGSEFEILLSAPNELFKKIVTLFVEIHPVPGHSPDMLKKLLVDQGYNVSISKTNGAVLIATKNPSA